MIDDTLGPCGCGRPVTAKDLSQDENGRRTHGNHFYPEGTLASLKSPESAAAFERAAAEPNDKEEGRENLDGIN